MKHYLNLVLWLAMVLFVGTCQAQELGYEVSGYSGNVYVYGDLVGHIDDTEVEGYLFDPCGKANSLAHQIYTVPMFIYPTVRVLASHC